MRPYLTETFIWITAGVAHIYAEEGFNLALLIGVIIAKGVIGRVAVGNVAIKDKPVRRAHAV